MKAKVLHVLEAFAGGTERHLLDLIHHVPDVEHVIAVPSTHLGEATAAAATRARDLGARVEPVEMNRQLAPHGNAAALASLRRLMHRIDPDVLHGHSSVGGALARLAGIGSGIPVIYTPNGVSRATWALAAERVLRLRTSRLIAVSASEGEFVLSQGLIGEDRLDVVPNGIDLEIPQPMRRALREQLFLPASAPLVGCLGRLTFQKAPEVYVQACAIAGRRVANAHFVLVGTGPRRNQVLSAVGAAGLGERFHLLDALPDAAAAFGELDLYVLPSRFEGGPYTPLEAMRARTPVILTDVTGNRDTIEPDLSGLLVPVDDASALAAAIVDLLEDEPRRWAFADAGHERLTTLFDVRAMGEATARVYDSVLAPC